MSYGDEAFVYDDYIGNPTTYRGKSASWTHGRELTSYNGTTFTYDARGRREKKKKQNETAITFTYDSNGNLIKQNNGLEFFYDHTGVFAFKYNNFTYFYRKNAQNDVIAILDSTGNTVVKYVYDAWGNLKVLNPDGTENTEATFLGNINPFRYRSYYFDTETDLYFLKTRYYDPEIGRFITIDDISYLDPETINGLNLYAYCLNNPVMYIDHAGNLAISTTAIIIGAVVGLFVGLATAAYYDYTDDYSFNGDVGDYVFYGLTGALTGAIGGVFSKAAFATQLIISATVGASASIAEAYYTKEITEFSLRKLAYIGVRGAVTSVLSFAITSGISRFASKMMYKSIIGSNTSNHRINQALSKAGFGHLKIGQKSMKQILESIGETKRIKLIEYASTFIFDFITGVI